MKHDIAFFRSVFSLRDAPQEGLPEICVSGRSNVGKSSLINRLAKRRHLAKISQKPGKTRSLNYYLVDGSYYLIDLPGYGYAKVSKSERELFKELVNPYLNSRHGLQGIIQLIDARHGPVAGDKIMLDWIEECFDNVFYVFTKADKLSASKRAQLTAHFAGEFGKERMTLFSARTGMGTAEIWSWINRAVS